MSLIADLMLNTHMHGTLRRLHPQYRPHCLHVIALEAPADCFTITSGKFGAILSHLQGQGFAHAEVMPLPLDHECLQ